ncbi:hypothetical protein H4R19_001991 [Coemansia spiralis]|nr:hypothetical protein H4R19_001991 [Coemansia spiralis]
MPPSSSPAHELSALRSSPAPRPADAHPSSTPTRRVARIPQSAPAKARPQALLTSPAAARRSQASMETLKMARALKEGLAQLKARADPLAQRLVSPRRVQRTASAAATVPRTSSIQNCRPHMPLYGSFSSDSSDCPGGLLDTDLLHARPIALHASRSCPQRPRQNNAPRTAIGRPVTPPGSALLEPTDRHNVAEAAEAMILFMHSESSSQNDHPAPDTAGSAAADSEAINISDAESVSYDSPAPQPPPNAKRSHTDSRTDANSRTDAAGPTQRSRRRLD